MVVRVSFVFVTSDGMTGPDSTLRRLRHARDETAAGDAVEYELHREGTQKESENPSDDLHAGLAQYSIDRAREQKEDQSHEQGTYERKDHADL